jgi:hypothetical protein
MTSLTRPAAQRLAGIGAVLAAAAVACAALAVVAHPQYDPYGWLLWGRELARGSGFSTVQYPSWKPLAALLALPASLAGAAAPAAWLVLERVLALGGVVLAYVAATRLAGRAAGIVAAASLLLVTGWLAEMLDGHIEPVVASLLLAACLLDARERAGAALACLVAAALARPDAWLALGVYGLYLMRTRRLAWPTVIAAGLAVPLLWFGGDVMGSGSALHGGQLARHSAPAVHLARQGNGVSAALSSAIDAPLAVLGLAAVCLLAAGIRRRERLVITLGALAATWLATDVALAAAGYPADARFAMPSGALVTVLGAAGLIRAGRHVAQRTPPGALRLAAAGAVAITVAASALPAADTAAHQARVAARYSDKVAALSVLDDQLSDSAMRTRRLAVGQPFRAALAWYSDRTIAQLVHPHRNGVAIALTSSEWRHLRRLLKHHPGIRRRLIAARGVWRAYLLLPGAAGRRLVHIRQPPDGRPVARGASSVQCRNGLSSRTARACA